LSVHWNPSARRPSVSREPSSPTTAYELELLKRKAASVDLYVNQHTSADLTRGGDLYVQPRRHGQGHVNTLLRYARASEVLAFLVDHENDQRA
jgi:hypothetical protein